MLAADAQSAVATGNVNATPLAIVVDAPDMVGQLVAFPVIEKLAYAPVAGTSVPAVLTVGATVYNAKNNGDAIVPTAPLSMLSKRWLQN
jgi:hypothetical protein